MAGEGIAQRIAKAAGARAMGDGIRAGVVVPVPVIKVQKPVAAAVVVLLAGGSIGSYLLRTGFACSHGSKENGTEQYGAGLSHVSKDQMIGLCKTNWFTNINKSL